MCAFQACVFIARVNCTVNMSKLRLGKTQVSIFYLNIYKGSYMCVVSESNKYCILLYRTMLLNNLLILSRFTMWPIECQEKLRWPWGQILNKVSENTSSKEHTFACLFTMLCFLKGVLWNGVFCSVNYSCILWNGVFCEVQLCFMKCVLWSTVVFCEMLCFVKCNCVLWNVFVFCVV